VFAYAAAIKTYLAPLAALQVSQQVLVQSGFVIFDPLQPGKVTVCGEHPSGVLVTVVSIDCEGGSATVVNSFSPHDAASAEQMMLTIHQAIQAS
jgi:hypothetical protein